MIPQEPETVRTHRHPILSQKRETRRLRLNTIYRWQHYHLPFALLIILDNNLYQPVSRLLLIHPVTWFCLLPWTPVPRSTIRTWKIHHSWHAKSVPSNGSIGALYVGVLVSAVLHGLCLLQAFLYFQSSCQCGILLQTSNPFFTEYTGDLWYIKVAVRLWIDLLFIVVDFSQEVCRW